MTIIRVIIHLCLLYGVYAETGPVTTLSFFLLFLGLECIIFVINDLSRKTKEILCRQKENLKTL